MLVDRRSLLCAFATLSLPTYARSQSAPLILRPSIEGVDPRYSAYATVGPNLFPSAPVTFRTSRSNVVLFHPENVEKARLIVFSHGALADPLTYRDLLWHWTSHGYAVAAPLHSDSIIEAGPTLRTTDVGEVSKWPISALLEDPEAWQDRVDECRACLDSVDLIAAAAGMEIDDSRPVIAGHGYGAYVGQLLVGAKVTGADGRAMDFSDPRFFSAIVMSPQGPGVMGLTEDSWSEVSSPILSLLTEFDSDFTGQPPMEKAKSYLLSKAGYKHIGFLKGGSANSFSGQIGRSNSEEASLFEVIKAMSTAFLHAYSDYDRQAFMDLTNDFFERMTLGLVDEGRR